MSEQGAGEGSGGGAVVTGACFSEEAHDHGFMGFTHALSALAVFLMLTAFFPTHVFAALGTASVAVLILACINLIGGCLSVDLDNTISTAESSLGVFGDPLSNVVRALSSFVQMTVRTNRDDAQPNPHRGFFHTVPAALLVGGGIFLLTTIPYGVTLPVLGAVTLGTVFAVVVTWSSLHMALQGLSKGATKKFKKKNGLAGELLVGLGSLAAVLALFTQIPEGLNFWWLGLSIAVGMVTHSLGDCFTTYGSPILFPFKRRGKRWWRVRFLGIKSGGFVESYLFIPLFAIVSIASALVIMGLRFPG